MTHFIIKDTSQDENSINVSNLTYVVNMFVYVHS